MNVSMASIPIRGMLIYLKNMSLGNQNAAFSFDSHYSVGKEKAQKNIMKQ